MTEPTVLPRRALLRIVGWIAFALTAGRMLPSWAHRPPSLGAVPLDGGTRILPLWESASAVGAEFLRARPSEANVATLLRLLGLPEADPSLLAETGRAALLARVSPRHRDDFRSGRVENLHGWTLSLTELRLGALIHLTQPHG